MVADTVADACGIYIDGVSVLTGYPFRQPAENIRKNNFLPGTSTVLIHPNYMFIDDILVSR